MGFREVIVDMKPAPAGSASRSMYSFKTIELANDFGKSKNDFHVVISDLKRNTRYGLIVQAFNRRGSGPVSDEIVAQTAEYDAPSPVGIKVLLSARNSLTLSLEGQSEETPVTGYVINYKSHQENWEELKVTGKRSHHVLENLRCGTKYQITVTAYNSAGRSQSSALVTASTAGNG